VRASNIFAWAGGGMFVASLAYCVGWYLFNLGHDAPFVGAGAMAWDAALVTIFACHHSIFARERVKARLTPLFGGRVRSVYVWVASVLLFLVCLTWRPIGGTVYDATGVAAVACVLVQATGVALIAWSVARIDPLELAGIGDRSPRDPTTPVPALPLQVGGPYRIVRHPLYLGWMFAAFATPHLTGDRLAFAVLTSFYLVIAVPWEERSLGRAFGDAYARYAAEVPWRVIPYVY
jgi:protein-S-isoprenylcysteine O-methyltransferase Ste14